MILDGVEYREWLLESGIVVLTRPETATSNISDWSAISTYTNGNSMQKVTLAGLTETAKKFKESVRGWRTAHFRPAVARGSRRRWSARRRWSSGGGRNGSDRTQGQVA